MADLRPEFAENGALGVYVSVPFCRAKCSFCNFASGVGTPVAIERYVESLCAEIGSVGKRAESLGAMLPRKADTVYFGGGTPSLLEPAQLNRILAAIRGQFDVAADAEITMEAAPGQISDELLKAALRLGVNRVSLGVQSFIDREAASVGRSHTGESCVAEIARLRRAGVGKVAADLIAGLPHQTDASWQRSLDAAVASELDHLSVYLFEVDEGSRLGAEVLGGGARFYAPEVPNEERASAMYERACAFLPEHGFGQYEISNFARAGFQAKHNRKYWERAPYVGFGLDAHSMLKIEGPGLGAQGPECAVRFANADELARYDGREPAEITRVDARGAFEEALFLGLRLVEGVSVAALRQRFDAGWVDEAAGIARELAAGGLMVVDGERWALTSHGRLVSNDVFGRLLESVAV
ncbi:radical SAM family heme chaperone HemW [Bryocella elongata]|nr:radical SAM family heme chaperone HemW [Bryocella elongata]